MLLRHAMPGDVIVFNDARIPANDANMRHTVTRVNDEGIRLVNCKFGIPVWYKLDSDLQCYLATC